MFYQYVVYRLKEVQLRSEVQMRQAMLPPRAVMLMDESFMKRFDLWRALAFRKNAQVARFSSYTDVMLQCFLK